VQEVTAANVIEEEPANTRKDTIIDAPWMRRNRIRRC
jgi:hypothetical protein